MSSHRKLLRNDYGSVFTYPLESGGHAFRFIVRKSVAHGHAAATAVLHGLAEDADVLDTALNAMAACVEGMRAQGIPTNTDIARREMQSVMISAVGGMAGQRHEHGSPRRGHVVVRKASLPGALFAAPTDAPTDTPELALVDIPQLSHGTIAPITLQPITFHAPAVLREEDALREARHRIIVNTNLSAEEKLAAISALDGSVRVMTAAERAALSAYTQVLEEATR